jgi:hypothetical protein
MVISIPQTQTSDSNNSSTLGGNEHSRIMNTGIAVASNVDI